MRGMLLAWHRILGQQTLTHNEVSCLTLLHSPVLAAHTLLDAAIPPNLSLENHDALNVIPWGRLHLGLTANLQHASKTAEAGKKGRATEF